jgi:hypothetical protein
VGRYNFDFERFTSAYTGIPMAIQRPLPTLLQDHMLTFLQLRIFHVTVVAHEVLAEDETRCERCFRSTLNLSDITSTVSLRK